MSLVHVKNPTHTTSGCRFLVPSTETGSPPRPAVPFLPIIDDSEGRELLWDIYVAVKTAAHWTIRQSRYTTGSSVWCQGGPFYELVYPIDPAMTAGDIERATVVKPNTTNTAWLFFHGTAAVHQRHIIDIRKAIVGEFAEEINDLTIKILDSGTLPAADLKRQALRNLIEYQKAVTAQAVKVAKAHEHGHLIKNASAETDFVHAGIREALKVVKAEWAADTAKLAKYRTIASFVTNITRDYASPHQPETRWDRAARLEKEKNNG